MGNLQVTRWHCSKEVQWWDISFSSNNQTDKKHKQVDDEGER